MLHDSDASSSAHIGGYRLLRPLGAGPRATVHLGYAEGHPHAAVKEYAAGVPAELVEREAEALMRAAGPHVVRLDDLALDRRGRAALLLERIPGPTLGALLDRRGRLRPGEAVTILAPLASTVGRLHRSGVVHGGLDAGSVLFSAEGAPTLAGFGDAQLVDAAEAGAEAVRRRRELFSRDALALHRLAVAVLDATVFDETDLRDTDLDGTDPVDTDPVNTDPEETAPGSVARGAVRRLAALHSVAETDPLRYPDRLADTVFGLAEPEPVDLLVPERRSRGVPARVGGSDRGSPSDAAAQGLTLGALPLPEWLTSAVRGVLTGGGRRLRAVGAVAGSVRRRFWVAGGVAAAALIVAVAVVPTGTEQDGTAPPSAGPGAAEGPSSSAPSSIAPAPATPLPISQPQPAVTGDDPAAAALVLLRARAECFRELSVLCLDAVDHADSSAAQADEAAILAAQAGGELAAAAVLIDGDAEVVERLGDTALVRITPVNAEPASVLVIRTEAGWRIRGFPGTPRGGAAAD